MTKRQPQPRETTVRVVSIQMYDGTPVTSPEAQGRIARALLGDPETNGLLNPEPGNTAQKSA